MVPIIFIIITYEYPQKASFLEKAQGLVIRIGERYS